MDVVPASCIFWIIMLTLILQCYFFHRGYYNCFLFTIVIIIIIIVVGHFDFEGSRL